MAKNSTLPITNASYTGSELAELFFPLLNDRGVLMQAGVSLFPAIKDKAAFLEIGTNAKLTGYECVPTPANVGNFSADQVTVDLAQLQLLTEECNKVLLDTIRSQYVNGGFNEMTFQSDSEFMGAITAILLNKFAVQTNDLLINGDTGGTPIVGREYLQELDGLLAKLEAKTGVIKVDGATLTAANIVAEIDSFILDVVTTNDSIVAGIKGRPVIMVSPTTLTLYRAAKQGAGTAYPLQAVEGTGLDGVVIPAYGYDMIAVPFMPANTMVMAVPTNIGVFLNSTDDMASLQITDVSLSNSHNDYTTMALRAAMGIDFMVPTEMAYYRIP